MSAPGLEGLDRLLGGLVSGVAEATLESALLLALAAGAAALIARGPASARHRLWAVALGGTLVAPLAAPWMPAWEVGSLPAIQLGEVRAPVPGDRLPPSPAIEWAGSAAAIGAWDGSDRATEPAARPPRTEAPSAAASSGPSLGHLRGASGGGTAPVVTRTAGATETLGAALDRWSRPLALWALAAWALVGTLLLLRLAAGLARVRRLARGARPLEGAWRRELEDAKKRLGIDRPLRLLLSGEVRSPMVFGYRRPVLLLPAAAAGWSRERRRVVLLHELAHVARGDWPVRVAARLAVVVYWFHPLVRLAAKRLVIEQERACDETVIELGTRPSTYARHLLEIARAMGGPRPLPALEMARRSEMEGRLMSILDSDRAGERRPLTFAAVLAIVLLVPVLAAIRPGPAESAAGLAAELSPVAAPGPVPVSESPPAESAQQPSSAAVAEIEAIERRLEPMREEVEKVEASMAPREERLEAIERELEPFESELEGLERRLEPLQHRMEEMAREMEARMSGVEVELEPLRRQLEGLETELEPLHEVEREIEEAMAPISEELELLHEKLEPLHEELGRLGERLGGGDEAAEHSTLVEELARVQADLAPEMERLGELHEAMRPFYERMAELHETMRPTREEMRALHERMRPLHERLRGEGSELRQEMERLREQMEPLHEELRGVHEQMRPIYERLREVHREARPAYEELRRTHERMRPHYRDLRERYRALRGEMAAAVAAVIRAEMSSMLSADADVEGAAWAVIDDLHIEVEEGVARLRASTAEVMARLENELGGERWNAGEADLAAAAERTALAILAIELGR